MRSKGFFTESFYNRRRCAKPLYTFGLFHYVTYAHFIFEREVFESNRLGQLVNSL